jgi:hypothetical protein
LRVGREEFEVNVGVARVVVDDLLMAVSDELFRLSLSEECHLAGSLVCADPNGVVTKTPGHEGPRGTEQ